MNDERKQQAERLVTGLLSLSKFPRKPLPADFEATLHRRLVEAAAEQPRPVKQIFPLIRPALIAVAFLVVFVVGFIVGSTLQKERFRESDPHEQTAPNDTTAPKLIAAKTVVQPNTPVTIRLIYESARDIDRVRFAIVLDRGVRFRSDDPEIASRSELEWEGSLATGRNEIPIVVTVDDPGERIIRAYARFNGSTTEQVITLVAREEQKNV